MSRVCRIDLGEFGKLSLLLAVVLVMGTRWASGTDFVQGRLVPVSGPSPFAECTADNAGGQIGAFAPNSEAETSLAVNPLDPNNIVALWMQDVWSNQGARGLVAGVSFTGGRTWQRIVLPGYTLCSGGEYLRAADPWLAFAPNGDLYAAAMGVATPATGFAPSAFLVSKSTDGGLTWSSPITIIRETDSRYLNDKVSITADPFDPSFAYLVWDRSATGGKAPVLFSRTTDAGQTWEKPRIIFNSSADSRTINNMILVLPDGTLVNLFTEYDFVNTAPFFGNFRVMATHSEDRGETWARHSKALQVTDILWENCGRPVLGCVANPDTGEFIRTAPAVFDAAVDPSSGALYVA